MRVGAIIVAAGSGRRFGGRPPKQMHLLDGIPVLVRALEKFNSARIVNEICLVVKKNYIKTARQLVKRYAFIKVHRIVAGGKERQDSVYNGLMSTAERWDIVMVHDGVRPFIDQKIIERVVLAAKRYGGAIPAIHPVDTIKLSSGEGIVKSTVDRRKIWLSQTPQAFRFHILRVAYEKARKDGYVGTDDAELVERAGYRVRIVDGSPFNMKITTREDMDIARAIAGKRY